MAENDFNGLFGKIELPAEEGKKNNRPEYEYRVSFKDAKDGVYTSVIKFVPWHKAPNKSVMAKKVSWVTNPSTKYKRAVDNGTSVGEKDPISAMYWEFRNSGDKRLEGIANEYLSTTNQYASLIQIIEDKQHPELVGRIMSFRYGHKIYSKIKDEQSGEYGPGVSPFDIMNGRLFVLKVCAQNGMNNYDQSSFMDIRQCPCGLRYKKADGNYAVADDSSDKNEIMNYLVTESPNLDEYGFHEWDADTEKFVYDALAAVKEYATTGVIPNARETAFGGQPASQQAPSFPGVTFAPNTVHTAPAAPSAAMPIPPVSVNGQKAVNESFPGMGGASVVKGVDVPEVSNGRQQAPAAPKAGASNPFGDLDDVINF